MTIRCQLQFFKGQTSDKSWREYDEPVFQMGHLRPFSLFWSFNIFKIFNIFLLAAFDPWSSANCGATTTLFESNLLTVSYTCLARFSVLNFIPFTSLPLSAIYKLVDRSHIFNNVWLNNMVCFVITNLY